MHLFLLSFTLVLLAFNWCTAEGTLLWITDGAVHMITMVLDSNIEVIFIRFNKIATKSLSYYIQ